MASNPNKKDRIVDLACAMYDSKIRHLVEPERQGEYLTLDVVTGEYEIDADDLAATSRMLERHSAENLFTFRIGYLAFGAFGMRVRPVSEDQAGVTGRRPSKTLVPAPGHENSVVSKGIAIYDAKIRHLVEPECHGEYITLDIETGDYEVDTDSLAANFRMLERHSAETLVSLRIGYPAFGTFGMRVTPARGGETGVARRRGYKAPVTGADGAAVVDQAYAIYEAKIRHLVEPEHHGEYLALDVKTGEYEIDIDDMAANSRMLERHSPETLVMMRIGFPAFGTFVGWRGLMP